MQFHSIHGPFFRNLAWPSARVITSSKAELLLAHVTILLSLTRGRKRKISDDQLKEADHILQDQDLQLEGKRYTWDALAQEIGADVMGRTMKRTLTAALNYHKCLACVKGWLAMASEERREEFATVMLNKYPRSED